MSNTFFQVRRKNVGAVAIGKPERQATIEITCHDHSIIACSRHMYMGVILRTHPIRGESHIQRNASGEVATGGFALPGYGPGAKS